MKVRIVRKSRIDAKAPNLSNHKKVSTQNIELFEKIISFHPVTK